MSTRVRWWESARNLSFTGTVVAAVIATVIAGALVIWFQGNHLWRWISSAGRWLIFPVPVPRIGIVVIVGTLVLFVGRWLATLLGPSPPPYLTYRQDMFLEVIWRWDYDGHYLAKHSIAAFCPRCETRLRPESHGYMTFTTTIACEECGFRREVEGNGPEVIDRVARLIEREANRKAQAAR
jgi:hypothetical protein